MITIAITIATALVACGPNDPDHSGFNIDIAYSVDHHGCPSETCGFYKTACGAKLSVRLVDADTGELLTSDCVDIDGVDLCEINEADVTLSAVRPGMARIEVALWNADDLVDGQCPDEDIFDSQPRGAPREDYHPYPAVGGATYFNVGTAADVQVELACGDYEHLDEESCKLLVTARVDDLASALPVPRETASGFVVAVGEPIAVSEDGDVHWSLGADELTVLQFTDLALPIWAGEVQNPFTDHLCITVLNEPEFQALTSAHCIEFPEEPNMVELGLFADKDTVEKILQAAQLATFPESGLVLGRVIDHLRQGVDQVELQPTGGGVEYLNEDGTSFLNTLETASGGFFISRDAPFGTTWTAMHVVDGRRHDGVYTAGLIEGKLSVVIIKLEPPP